MNPHLLKDLTERGLWSDGMKNQLIAHNGSIQVERHPETEEAHLLYIINYILVAKTYILQGILDLPTGHSGDP